jgi:hypothetical protein|tara:strand:- start:1142 stop:1489 length:348 start_codon:yes stop_codon:yes gene_type:complete
MSTFAYYNITSASVTVISAIDSVSSTDTVASIKGSPTYITMCNRDASGDSCVVDLYIENSDASDTYYILHDVTIPGGATLILEKPELSYDSTLYKLKFQLTSVADTQLVDIKVQY